MLGKFPLSMSYRAVGCEFNDNESIIGHIKKKTGYMLICI